MLMIVKFFVATLLYMFVMFVLFTLSSKEKGFLRKLHCFYILVIMVASIYVAYMEYTPMITLYTISILGSLVLWLVCDKQDNWHFTALAALEIIPMSVLLFTSYLCIVIIRGHGEMVWELFN